MLQVPVTGIALLLRGGGVEELQVLVGSGLQVVNPGLGGDGAQACQSLGIGAAGFFQPGGKISEGQGMHLPHAQSPG